MPVFISQDKGLIIFKRSISIFGIKDMRMVIELQKPLTKNKVKKALARVSEGKKRKSLRKHFGKLKRGLGGVEYQKKVRNEWD